MTTSEIERHVDAWVMVTLRNGSRHEGHLRSTRDKGLYQVVPRSTQAGAVETLGPLADIYAEAIESIVPGRP